MPSTWFVEIGISGALKRRIVRWSNSLCPTDSSTFFPDQACLRRRKRRPAAVPPIADPAQLDDTTLVEAIPKSGIADGPPLAAEVGRRAGGLWEPGTRRWLVEWRRIGPVLREISGASLIRCSGGPGWTWTAGDAYM